LSVIDKISVHVVFHTATRPTCELAAPSSIENSVKKLHKPVHSYGFYIHYLGNAITKNFRRPKSIHLESDQTTTLETTYIVSQKIALGRTSEELQALNSASEKPVPDNSNGPLNTSEKSIFIKSCRLIVYLSSHFP
ncbi:hypothetical protein L9F63_014374, partial [Diploptera punctata]